MKLVNSADRMADNVDRMAANSIDKKIFSFEHFTTDSFMLWTELDTGGNRMKWTEANCAANGAH